MRRMRDPTPSAAQQRVLDALVQLKSDLIGNSPTLAELASLLCLSRRTVSCHLQALESIGYIGMDGQSRSRYYLNGERYVPPPFITPFNIQEPGDTT